PLSEITFSILCKVVYLNFPSIYKKEEILFIGDKNPEYVMHMDSLLEVFPEAKIIHIVRDYRANIISHRKWFPRKNIMILAQKWLLFNRYIEKHKRKGVHPFYTIRYEDLVENPEKYSKEICEFIGITYFPQMLDFHKKISKTYLEDQDRIEKNTLHVRMLGTLHENLVKPINKEKVDSWKEEMTKNEIIIADFVDGDFAKKYGYEKITNERNLKLLIMCIITRFRYKLDVFIIREYYNLPLWTRPVLRFVAEKLFDWFGIAHIYNAKYRKRKKHASQKK
ncbi:MAG: sulfotransferase, partial [Bacteroidetes bacterium]|nr:sulfotransferase [Bacteroidota bacterium]